MEVKSKCCGVGARSFYLDVVCNHTCKACNEACEIEYVASLGKYEQNKVEDFKKRLLRKMHGGKESTENDKEIQAYNKGFNTALREVREIIEKL